MADYDTFDAVHHVCRLGLSNLTVELSLLVGYHVGSSSSVKGCNVRVELSSGFWRPVPISKHLSASRLEKCHPSLLNCRLVCLLMERSRWRSCHRSSFRPLFLLRASRDFSAACP